MSLLAMTLGDWFCVSRKGGTGGGELVHPKGQNSMTVLGLGWAVSANGPRKQSSYLMGPPCSVQVQFISYRWLALPKQLDHKCA